MPRRRGNQPEQIPTEAIPPGAARGVRLIRAREDVVVTSSREAKSGRRTYYIKINETGEIFEFGEDEYELWKNFAGGISMADAETAATAKFGSGFTDRLRKFVADLAVRGLLGGDLPPDLVEEFEQDERARWRPFLIDPATRDRSVHSSKFRLVLGDPNAFFGWLSRWLGWLRFTRWPLTILSVIALMVLFKHATYFSNDFHSVILNWGKIPHAVLTFFTINFTRVIGQGAVSRHYGARVRYMSIDLVYGVWPRFHEDKKGILALERTPQLWSHATPFFIRIGFFSLGTLGWWWFRGDGSNLYQYCLLLSQAAIADFATATLPIFRNETYFWFCALQRDPVLQDRGKAAIRTMLFLPKGMPRHLSAIEKLALMLYGLSMLLAFVILLVVGITMLTGLTGEYFGAGFSLVLVMIALAATKMLTIRALKARLLTERASRRAEQRSFRRGGREPALEPAPGD